MPKIRSVRAVLAVWSLAVLAVVVMTLAAPGSPAWSQAAQSSLKPVEMSIDEIAFSEIRKGGCRMSMNGNTNTPCAAEARAWCANRYNDGDQSVAAVIVGTDTAHSGARVAIACLLPKKH